MTFSDPTDPNFQEERRKLLSLPFEMQIEDVFSIEGHGVCITGRAKAGRLRKGDKIRIVSEEKSIETTVARFKGFIRYPDSYVAQAGDNTFILIKDINVEDVETGMIIFADKK